jgi:hypothetical protein
MKNKRWAFTEELVLTLVLLAMVLVFLVLAFGYPSQARTFPLLVAVPLTIGLIVQSVLSARVAAGAQGSTAESRQESLITSVWMIGLILIIWLLGMVPAMFVIPVIYMRFYCGESWKPTLIVSIFLLVVTVAFMRWLQIPALPGVLDFLLDPVRSAFGL